MHQDEKKNSLHIQILISQNFVSKYPSNPFLDLVYGYTIISKYMKIM